MEIQEAKKDYFSYNDGGKELEGFVKISPSKASKFLDNTNEWYRETLLGEESFTGSTPTNLGTVVHAGIEMYINTGEVDFDAIEKHIQSIKDPTIDKDYISSSYPEMVAALMNYVDTQGIRDKPRLRTEEYVKILDKENNIAIAGSIDLSCAGKIRDWKTTSALTPPKKMSRSYWFQQMIYAWILTQLGVPIHTIALVYVTAPQTGRVSPKTGKPLKDYPSVTHEVSETVTQENLDMIGDYLELIKESIILWNKKPQLRHILAQDMRLKVPQKKKLNKKERRKP